MGQIWREFWRFFGPKQIIIVQSSEPSDIVYPERFATIMATIHSQESEDDLRQEYEEGFWKGAIRGKYAKESESKIIYDSQVVRGENVLISADGVSITAILSHCPVIAGTVIVEIREQGNLFSDVCFDKNGRPGHYGTDERKPSISASELDLDTGAMKIVFDGALPAGVAACVNYEYTVSGQS